MFWKNRQVLNGICTNLQAEVEAASSEAEALAAQHGFSDVDAADVLSDMAATQAAGSAPGAPQSPQPGLEQSGDASGTADSTPAAAHTNREPPAEAAHQQDDAEGALDGAATATADDADHAVPSEPPIADPTPADGAEAADADPGEAAPEAVEAPAEGSEEVHAIGDDPRYDAGGVNGGGAAAKANAGTGHMSPAAEELHPDSS